MKTIGMIIHHRRGAIVAGMVVSSYAAFEMSTGEGSD
jgi:hypothetical protein